MKQAQHAGMPVIVGVEDTDTKLAQASAETEENKASSDQGQTEERTGTEASKTDASGLLIKGKCRRRLYLRKA